MDFLPYSGFMELSNGMTRVGLGEVLASLRRGEGLSQEELASRMDLSQARVSQLEREGPASVEALCLFVNSLGISVQLVKGIVPIASKFKKQGRAPMTARGLLYRS